MREIKGFENYMITEDGNVFSKNAKRYLKIITEANGYGKVNLCQNGNRSPKYVHRLVAEAFLENKNDFPVINHKDSNKLNNNKDNLEWCTHKYNLEYSGVVKKSNEATRKGVKQLDKSTGTVINVFDSMMEAERSTGIYQSHISACCSGKLKTAGGYKWEIVQLIKGIV